MSKENRLQHGIFALLGASWLGFIIFLWVSSGVVLALVCFILAGASLFVLYRELDIKPRERIAEIKQLSKAIDKQMDDNPQPILLANTPVEIRPIVQSLNALIKFQLDRYQQERDFTANASHELRTPLAGIRLQTEIAMMTEDEEQKNNALNNVIKAVDRGTRLVEQLLVLSRLTMDKMVLDVAEFDLAELCQQKVQEYKNAAQNKPVQLTYAKPSTACRLNASEASLDILLDNLLRNAINYTPIDGDIHVYLKQQGNEIIVEVSDTGPGIPTRDHERVFNRFQKASSSSKSGTGLGLAIVKRIVDLHHGTVSLSFSEGNHGLSVTIKLPADNQSLINFDSEVSEHSLQQVQN